jgi:putative FmdB family regulatory protein
VPIYEYQCANCNHKLECIQRVDDNPLLTCPNCNTDNLRKLVSKTSFRLKGSGWYVTDFKDKKKSGQPETGKAEPAAKEDTKPAATPAATSTDSQEAGGSA